MITNQVCFSIDSENTGAIDDALSVSQLTENLFDVSVHITDVSAIIPENNIIDLAAK